MPLPDPFTAANGTLLATYDPTWVVHASYSGTIVIQSNKAVWGATAAAMSYYNTTQFLDADVSVVVNFSSTTNNNGGVTGRIQTGAETFYMARLNSGNVRLERMVAGSSTLIGTSSHGITTGADGVLTLSMVGSTIRALVNGNVRVSGTDTGITLAGFCGIRFGNANNNVTLDNFNFYGASGVASANAPMIPHFARMGLRGY